MDTVSTSIGFSTSDPEPRMAVAESVASTGFFPRSFSYSKQIHVKSELIPKENRAMSLACAFSTSDGTYLVADSLVTTPVRNKNIYHTEEKLFAFPNSCIGCAFTGQLTFDADRLPISRIIESITARTAEEAANKLCEALSSHELVFDSNAFIADVDTCFLLSVDKSPETGIFTTKIQKLDTPAVTFAGRDWATAYAKYLVVDTSNPQNQPEQIINVFRTIISMDRQLPIAHRSIDYPISVLKISSSDIKQWSCCG